MIRQIYHNRTIQQLSVLQLFQNFSKKSILIAAECEIMLQAPFLFLPCQLAEPFLCPPVQIGLIHKVILKAFRKFDFLQRIQLQIFFRHDVWVMRSQRSHIHTEGLVLRKLSDFLSGCPDHVLISKGIFRFSILAVFRETDTHNFPIPSERSFLKIIPFFKPAPVPHIRNPFLFLRFSGLSIFPVKLFKSPVLRAFQRADMPFSAVIQMISIFLQVLRKQPYIIIQSL